MEFEDLFLTGVPHKCMRADCREVGTAAPVLEFRDVPDRTPPAVCVLKGLVCAAHQAQFDTAEDWLTHGSYERIVYTFKHEGKLIPVRSLSTLRWFPYNPLAH